MVLASSHLLLVTNGAVIGGAVECSYLLLVTSGAVLGGVREFKYLVSN